MAQVIVRNIEEDVKAGLKLRARRHGWSMEEEVRQILRRAISEEEGRGQQRPGMGSRIAARFAGVGLDEPLTEFHGQPIAPMDLGA